MKIDQRRHYVLVVDTETTNALQTDDGKLDLRDSLVYDCGWAIADTRGNIYRESSYVNGDIFYKERDLMQSAFYADKIPQYQAEVEDNFRLIATTAQIRQAMLYDMRLYGVKEVVAHNAPFDIRALNNTRRYVYKSRFRHWFPIGTRIWDTMRMAESTVCKMPSYKRFCETHDLVNSQGKPSKKAETIYKFITGNLGFVESHTGLEDVRIEVQILAYCYRQHKAMRKLAFTQEKDINLNPTKFQLSLDWNLRKKPMLKGAF